MAAEALALAALVAFAVEALAGVDDDVLLVEDATGTVVAFSEAGELAAGVEAAGDDFGASDDCCAVFSSVVTICAVSDLEAAFEEEEEVALALTGAVRF